MSHPGTDRGTLISVHPILRVRDITRDVSYYVDCLGFTLDWEWGYPTARAGLRCDDVEIHVVADDRFAPTHPSYVYVLVKNVDALYSACVARGAEIVMPLDDRPFWGPRLSCGRSQREHAGFWRALDHNLNTQGSGNAGMDLDDAGASGGGILPDGSTLRPEIHAATASLPLT